MIGTSISEATTRPNPRPVTVVMFGGSVSAAHHLEHDAPEDTLVEALKNRYVSTSFLSESL